jgi:probable DNA metabolism protein
MMENSKILVYDGSFNGFLTSVYRAFESRIELADIRRRQDRQKSMFAEMLTVITETDKAKRVWNGIEKKNYQAVRSIYFAFLSEHKGIELLLYRYIRSLFTGPGESEKGKGSALSLKIDALADLVGQEKKRLEAGLKLGQREEHTSLAVLSPRFDILPLITRHIRTRFPDRSWLLYDKKRQYGLHFNRQQMKVLRLSAEETGLLLQTGRVSQDSAIWYQNPALKNLSTKWKAPLDTDPARVPSGKHMLQGNSAA